MVTAYIVLIALVGLERLVELRVSKRNAERTLGRGGVEFGQGHFGVMRIMHTAFLFACIAEVLVMHRPFVPALGIPMLGLVIAAQGLRYWAIGTLGDRWNVRVIVVPGEAPVARGPYRFLRHPNYLAVVIEIIALPLVHGAWLTAIAFTIGNALLLRTRIACEERALDGYAVPT